MAAAPRDGPNSNVVVATKEGESAGFGTVRGANRDTDSVVPHALPDHVLNRSIRIDAGSRLKEPYYLGRQQVVACARFKRRELGPHLVPYRIPRVRCGLVFEDHSGDHPSRVTIQFELQAVESLVGMLHMGRTDHTARSGGVGCEPRHHLEEPTIAMERIVPPGREQCDGASKCGRLSGGRPQLGTCDNSLDMARLSDRDCRDSLG